MILLNFPHIEEYDILQVRRAGQWFDFSTIRTLEEARQAVRFTEGEVPEDFKNAEAWRIVKLGFHPPVVLASSESLGEREIWAATKAAAKVAWDAHVARLKRDFPHAVPMEQEWSQQGDITRNEFYTIASAVITHDRGLRSASETSRPSVLSQAQPSAATCVHCHGTGNWNIGTAPIPCPYCEAGAQVVRSQG